MNMQRTLFLTTLALAAAALIYLPGTILYGWPGQAWTLAGFAPVCFVVMFAGIKRAAEAHGDRAP
jgi:hypothetical protein